MFGVLVFHFPYCDTYWATVLVLAQQSKPLLYAHVVYNYMFSKDTSSIFSNLFAVKDLWIHEILVTLFETIGHFVRL